jgi:hypothetical protein
MKGRKKGTKLSPEQLEKFRAKHKATKEARSKEQALEQIKSDLPSASDQKEVQAEEVKSPVGVY